MKVADEHECPCGSGHSLGRCCLPVIKGLPAKTAEALMRSRYTAYVLGDESYLLRSWHPKTRPRSVEISGNEKWLGLKIKRTEAGGADDATGIVEFVARFKIGGKGHRMHEISRFEQSPEGWWYVDGDLAD